jgi:NADPH:quinone reductase-like Zn-dependent oxidoreductase
LTRNCHLVSGTGIYACQLAKNVFRAGKVITTVSTSKVAKIPELLGEGVVDQSMYPCLLMFPLYINLALLVIDYTKEDPADVIPSRSVDFMFDTTGQSMQFLSLMVPSTSYIVSISTQPSATTLQASSVMRRPDNPVIPFFGRVYLNASDALRRLRAWRWGVIYMYWFLDPNGEDLKTLTRFVDEGKVVPVVGAKVDIHNIEKVREACNLTYGGKGGVGKTVIEVIKS